ncbi:hypothetical protein SNE40_009447 [Patella caerulea]|uniref:Uncharacterized protein n=1 Tax=Patella caerulea TaxID=87958 RepID=A0AAN8JU53_PATCE
MGSNSSKTRDRVPRSMILSKKTVQYQGKDLNNCDGLTDVEKFRPGSGDSSRNVIPQIEEKLFPLLSDAGQVYSNDDVEVHENPMYRLKGELYDEQTQGLEGYLLGRDINKLRKPFLNPLKQGRLGLEGWDITEQLAHEGILDQTLDKQSHDCIVSDSRQRGLIFEDKTSSDLPSVKTQTSLRLPPIKGAFYDELPFSVQKNLFTTVDSPPTSGADTEECPPPSFAASESVEQKNEY